MSRVSYFQRFSQKENHATNNTLLALRYFYESSPAKLSAVLASLLDREFKIGPEFAQQVRRKESVPDAVIRQPPFSITVETKRGGEIDLDQIRRHLTGLADEPHPGGIRLLLSLTKEPLLAVDKVKLQSEATNHSVQFAAVTFSEILEALRAQCTEYERELTAIVQDYHAYLAVESLLSERDRWMAIFPCGDSLNENAAYGLYYEPDTRPAKRTTFIGIYAQKAVQFIGRVEAIAICRHVEGRAEFEKVAGELREEHKRRFLDAVGVTKYYNLREDDHRVYFVEKFVPTRIEKVTPGGIMGFRYVDLQKLLLGTNFSTFTVDQMATALRGKPLESPGDEPFGRAGA